MNIKCTLMKLGACIIISPIIIYAVLYVAKFFGASYEMTHGEAFIVWLLMALLISNVWVWKK